MAMIEIDSLSDPRVIDYCDVKDRELRVGRDSFLVEGQGSLRCLLSGSRYSPESLLLNPRAARALEAELASLDPDVPVYLAERSLYKDIVGFDMHRGCLALCRRLEEPSLEDLLQGSGAHPTAPIVVVEGITNHDNMGALFRNAQAFGAGALLLCPRSCDPLYRKAIRTSVGASLCVPFRRAETWPDPLKELRAAGYRVVGLHPAEGGLELSALELSDEPLALVVGTEGPGLSDGVLALCDSLVRIPMAPGFDSINVGLAAGIALHHVFAQQSMA